MTTARRPPLRWALALAWLLIVGAIAFSVALGTGAASERELIAISLYPVLAFGFGIGMLWAVRILRAQSSLNPRDYLGLLVVGAIGAGVTALARWYFFANFFDRL